MASELIQLSFKRERLNYELSKLEADQLHQITLPQIQVLQKQLKECDEQLFLLKKKIDIALSFSEMNNKREEPLDNAYQRDKKYKSAFTRGLRGAYKQQSVSGDCYICHKQEKIEKDHVLELQLISLSCCGIYHVISSLDFLQLSNILNSYENTQPLCKDCNIKKGQYIKWLLKEEPKKPCQGEMIEYTPADKERSQNAFRKLMNHFKDSDSKGINAALFGVHNLWQKLFNETL